MAIDFDGTGDFLSLGSAPVTAVPLSMACWFNPDDAVSLHSLMVLSDAGGTNQFELEAQGVDVGDPVRASTTAAGTASRAITSAGFLASTWQHACGVFATTSSRAVYLNGGNKGTQGTLRVPTGINRTEIAASGVGAQVLIGLLAEAAIWDVDLTDEDVAVLAKGYSPLLVRPQNLVAYWPLIKNDNVRDRVGGLTLTVNGNPTEAPHPRVFMPKRRQTFSVGGGFKPAWAAKNNSVLGAGVPA